MFLNGIIMENHEEEHFCPAVLNVVKLIKSLFFLYTRPVGSAKTNTVLRTMKSGTFFNQS